MTFLIAALLAASTAHADPQYSRSVEVTVRPSRYVMCANPRHASRGPHTHWGSFDTWIPQADMASADGARQQVVDLGQVAAPTVSFASSGPDYSESVASVMAYRLLDDWIEGQQLATSSAQNYALAAGQRADDEIEARAQMEAAAAAHIAALEAELVRVSGDRDAARDKYADYLRLNPPPDGE